MMHGMRPVVLLCAIAVIQAFITLCFPWKFLICAVFSFIVALLFFFVYFKKKKYLLAFLFFVCIMFGAVNPMACYIKHQKIAEDFTDSNQFTKDCVFTAKVYDCKTYTSFSVIDASLLEYNGAKLSKNHKCRINMYGSENYQKDDIITFSAKPVKVSTVKSEDFDTAGYLKSKGIFIYFDNALLISSSISDSKASVFEKLKSYTYNNIYRYTKDGFDFTASSICYALVSGDKDYIDQSIKDTFSKSGTTHLLCVSGMHLSVILGTVYAILSLFTIHKRTKTLFIIILGFLYTVFSGFALSTLRAAIISTITFSASLFGKKTDAFKSLFFTMLVIVLAYPYSVFDISARLSFCATLGILAFSSVIPKIKEKSIFTKVLNTIIFCFACNIGAVVFTLPLSVYSFSGFSTVSALATLLVSFACQTLLIAVLMLLLLSCFSGLDLLQLISQSLGNICTYICDYLTAVCSYFASFKYAYISTHTNKIVFVFIILLLLYVLFIFADFKRLQKFTVVLMLFSVICFSFLSLYTAIKDDFEYKVIYYRKNENDRQLSIKLANNGYLLVNADNKLCTDRSFDGFDRTGNNYLLIIPDEVIVPKVLIQNIKEFDRRFGIKQVFLPDTNNDYGLSALLEEHGINYSLFPNYLDFGKFTVTFECDSFYRITVDDSKDKTCIVFSDSYTDTLFDTSSNICAYFTRKTRDQFQAQTDTIHQSCIFYTRLSKGEEHKGIINTNGQKIFYIKE